MTENRIRHLPVVEDGRLAGIVTIGDVVNAFRSIAEDENAQLRQYIQWSGLRIGSGHRLGESGADDRPEPS